jgi:hypothetical protein
LVDAALRYELAAVPARTLRHHFRHSTGLRQTFIQQIRRARDVVELVRRGKPPLDAAHELGYANQPPTPQPILQILLVIHLDLVNREVNLILLVNKIWSSIVGGWR